MNELIDALRKHATWLVACGTDPNDGRTIESAWVRDMRDAADAIERLMAQVAELEQDKEFLQFLAKLYHDELDEETKKNIDGHLHYDCQKGEKA